MRMKNWCLSQRNPFQDPELQKTYLNGEVYGHPRFVDGSRVTTSSIQGITDCGTHKVIKTRNNEYEAYPGDVDPEYEKLYPGAYDRLKVRS